MDGNVTSAREYFDGEENARRIPRVGVFSTAFCIANTQRGKGMAEGDAHLHAKIRIAFRKIDNAIEILFPPRYFDTSEAIPKRQAFASQRAVERDIIALSRNHVNRLLQR